jgi:hypothetical protein
MALAFRPSRTGPYDFQLPLALHSAPLTAPPGDGETHEEIGASAGGAPAPAVAVFATGVQPQVVLSKGTLDFGACVVGRSGGSRRASPYAVEVYVRNNTEGEIQVGGAFEGEGGHSRVHWYGQPSTPS